MFGPGLQQSARRIAEKIVRPLAALGLTPNMATFLGLLLNSVAAVILAVVNLRIGGAVLLFAGAFDMVDGALARVRNQKTTFGAFFDSTLDRFSEGIVLLGVIVYALRQTHPLPHTIWLVSLTYVAGLGSLMVSYTRARAEGLGLECKSGLMARPERVLLLAAGLILGGASWLLWTMAILAATSTFTSVQRIFAVWQTLARKRPAQADTAASSSPAGDSAAPGRSADIAARDVDQRDQAMSQQSVSTGPRPQRPGPTSR